MKKLLFIFLLFPFTGFSQQWNLTNNDLTIDIKKNSGTTIPVGKWLSTFSIVGDSVKFTYQRNNDDAHFILYFDKDSVNTPTVASATALYDTLEKWVKNQVTSIVGITGTKAQFNTAVTDGDFLFVGDVTQYTDEMAQDAVGNNFDLTLKYTDATPSFGLNLSNANTWLADISVPAEVYGVGWNGSNEVPTKNDLYDKIETIVGASPGGLNTYVQFNDGGTFGGDADFTWDKTTNTLDVGGATSGKVELNGDLSYILFNSTMGSLQINGSDLQFRNATDYSFDARIIPSANNTIPLGIQNTNEFSDAFFGSGAVIGFNNNNITLTHSAAVLTVGGGDLKITSAGNASTSALTTSAVQTITGVKTFNDDVFEWNNPATTFQYRVSTSAIGADVVLTLPAFHQNERIAVEDYTGEVTGDRTSTSTSLADVTDLAAFSTAASTKYYFDFQLSVTTNATTVGILLSVNHSTAITSIRFNIMYPISATANNVQQNLTALDAGVQPTAGNGATIQKAQVWGTVTTNTAGTFALRFASETGAAVTVKAGSTGIISRVN